MNKEKLQLMRLKTTSQKLYPTNAPAIHLAGLLNKKSFTHKTIERIKDQYEIEINEPAAPSERRILKLSRPHYQLWYKQPQREYYGYFTNSKGERISTEYYGKSREKVLQLLLSEAKFAK